MRQEINHSLIKKLKQDHFGQVFSDVLETLVSSGCCGVYGLPGYGMEFFAKQVVYIIQQKYKEFGTLLINADLDNSYDHLEKMNLEAYLQKNKLILVLGEVLTPEHYNLFKYINYLKWTARDNLSVLTVSNYTLYSDYEKYFDYASELFVKKYHVKPFDIDGTEKIIQLNNEEYNWHTPMKLSRIIHEYSGGNPAITKYICMACYEEGIELIDFPELLIKLQPLRKRIKDISRLIPVLDIEQQQHLNIFSPNGELFSKLLKYYLTEESAEFEPLVHTKLSKTEQKLMNHLKYFPNKIITKDQISIILGQSLDSYSEWAIYKTMERIKRKLNGILCIENVHGKGWIIKSD